MFGGADSDLQDRLTTALGAVMSDTLRNWPRIRSCLAVGAR